MRGFTASLILAKNATIAATASTNIAMRVLAFLKTILIANVVAVKNIGAALKLFGAAAFGAAAGAQKISLGLTLLKGSITTLLPMIGLIALALTFVFQGFFTGTEAALSDTNELLELSRKQLELLEQEKTALQEKIKNIQKLKDLMDEGDLLSDEDAIQNQKEQAELIQNINNKYSDMISAKTNIIELERLLKEELIETNKLIIDNLQKMQEYALIRANVIIGEEERAYSESVSGYYDEDFLGAGYMNSREDKQLLKPLNEAKKLQDKANDINDKLKDEKDTAKKIKLTEELIKLYTSMSKIGNDTGDKIISNEEKKRLIETIDELIKLKAKSKDVIALQKEVKQGEENVAKAEKFIEGSKAFDVKKINAEITERDEEIKELKNKRSKAQDKNTKIEIDNEIKTKENEKASLLKDIKSLKNMKKEDYLAYLAVKGVFNIEYLNKAINLLGKHQVSIESGVEGDTATEVNQTHIDKILKEAAKNVDFLTLTKFVESGIKIPGLEELKKILNKFNVLKIENTRNLAKVPPKEAYAAISLGEDYIPEYNRYQLEQGFGIKKEDREMMNKLAEDKDFSASLTKFALAYKTSTVTKSDKDKQKLESEMRDAAEIIAKVLGKPLEEVVKNLKSSRINLIADNSAENERIRKNVVDDLKAKQQIIEEGGVSDAERPQFEKLGKLINAIEGIKKGAGSFEARSLYRIPGSEFRDSLDRILDDKKGGGRKAKEAENLRPDIESSYERVNKNTEIEMQKELATLENFYANKIALVTKGTEEYQKITSRDNEYARKIHEQSNEIENDRAKEMITSMIANMESKKLLNEKEMDFLKQRAKTTKDENQKRMDLARLNILGVEDANLNSDLKSVKEMEKSKSSTIKDQLYARSVYYANSEIEKNTIIDKYNKERLKRTSELNAELLNDEYSVKLSKLEIARDEKNEKIKIDEELYEAKMDILSKEIELLLVMESKGKLNDNSRLRLKQLQIELNITNDLVSETNREKLLNDKEYEEKRLAMKEEARAKLNKLLNISLIEAKYNSDKELQVYKSMLENKLILDEEYNAAKKRIDDNFEMERLKFIGNEIDIFKKELENRLETIKYNFESIIPKDKMIEDLKVQKDNDKGKLEKIKESSLSPDATDEQKADRAKTIKMFNESIDSKDKEIKALEKILKLENNINEANKAKIVINKSIAKDKAIINNPDSDDATKADAEKRLSDNQTYLDDITKQIEKFEKQKLKIEKENKILSDQDRRDKVINDLRSQYAAYETDVQKFEDSVDMKVSKLKELKTYQEDMIKLYAGTGYTNDEKGNGAVTGITTMINTTPEEEFTEEDIKKLEEYGIQLGLTNEELEKLIENLKKVKEANENAFASEKKEAGIGTSPLEDEINRFRETQRKIKALREKQQKDIKEKGYSDITDWELNTASFQNYIAVLKFGIDASKQAFDAIQQYKLEQLEKEIQANEEAKNKKIAIIEDENKAGLINARQADKEKAIIEEEALKREKELREQQKKWKIADALVGMASGIAGIWASELSTKSFWGIATATALTALLVGTTMAQIDAISSQKYATGGFTGSSIMQADETGQRPAGIVHENEFVFDRAATNGNVNELYSLMSALRGGAKLKDIINTTNIKRVSTLPSIPSRLYANGGFVKSVRNSNDRTDELLIALQSLNKNLVEKEMQVNVTNKTIGEMEVYDMSEKGKRKKDYLF